MKLNLATGAAVTAFPESMAPDGLQGNGNNYKTAAGELTPDKGQIRIKGRPRMIGNAISQRELRVFANHCLVNHVV